MHIWYISHYGGGPDVGVHDRAYRLAAEWMKLGHTVDVFVSAFHHLLDRPSPLPRELSVRNVRYISVPARPYEGNGVGRTLNMGDFALNLYGVAVERGRVAAPDVVIASSPHPFALFPAHRLARRYAARFVFEIRDLWALGITEILNVSRHHPFVQVCRMAERFGLRRADLVASVLPGIERYLVEQGYPEKPAVWVPNGLAEDAPGSHEERTAMGEAARAAAARLEAWRRDGHVVIVHAGGLGKPNAVDLLFDALAYGEAKGEAEGCRLLVLGSGEERPHLEARAEKMKLGVHFTGRIPKADVARLLPATDIGYAGVRPLPRLYRYGLSLNKFADYFNAELAVLLPVDPCGDPVSESGGGIARLAETPEALWSAVRELVRMTPDQRHAMGRRGKSYMAEAYAYDRIAQRYVDAIARCATAGSRADAVAPPAAQPRGDNQL